MSGTGGDVPAAFSLGNEFGLDPEPSAGSDPSGTGDGTSGTGGSVSGTGDSTSGTGGTGGSMTGTGGSMTGTGDGTSGTGDGVAAFSLGDEFGFDPVPSAGSEPSETGGSDPSATAGSDTFVTGFTIPSGTGFIFRVDLTSYDNEHAFAVYTNFSIDSEINNYTLRIGEMDPSSTAGEVWQNLLSDPHPVTSAFICSAFYTNITPQHIPTWYYCV